MRTVYEYRYALSGARPPETPSSLPHPSSSPFVPPVIHRAHTLSAYGHRVWAPGTPDTTTSHLPPHAFVLIFEAGIMFHSAAVDRFNHSAWSSGRPGPGLIHKRSRPACVLASRGKSSPVSTFSSSSLLLSSSSLYPLDNQYPASLPATGHVYPDDTPVGPFFTNAQDGGSNHDSTFSSVSNLDLDSSRSGRKPDCPSWH